MQTNFNLPVVTAGMTKTQITIIADQSVKNVLDSGNILEAVEAISVMETFIKEVKANTEFKSYGGSIPQDPVSPRNRT